MSANPAGQGVSQGAVAAASRVRLGVEAPFIGEAKTHPANVFVARHDLIPKLVTVPGTDGTSDQIPVLVGRVGLASLRLGQQMSMPVDVPDRVLGASGLVRAQGTDRRFVGPIDGYLPAIAEPFRDFRLGQSLLRRRRRGALQTIVILSSN